MRIIKQLCNILMQLLGASSGRQVTENTIQELKSIFLNEGTLRLIIKPETVKTGRSLKNWW
jgi:hypothetical protein